jgi:pyroglutamyl-peptidase
MTRPRVLLTGFGPFPGVAENPSAWLAETCAGSPEIDGELHLRILPTEWAAAALMPRLYANLQPHVMIHFGVSERANAFRIERSAHNRAALRADASQALPAGRVIRAEGPDRLDTALPASRLAAHLRTSGLPAVTSRSAGSYLCNFLYYHSLDWARRQPDPRLVLFVHVPPLTGQGGTFSPEDLLRGAHETVRFVLACLGAHASPESVSSPAFAPDAVLASARMAK